MNTTPGSAAPGRAAVVGGGGIAGLLAADQLTECGFAVTLLEASDRLGGIVRTDHADGLLLEQGPDSIHLANPAGQALIRRLGLTDRTVPNRPGGASIFWKGRLHPIPAGTVLGIPTSLRAIARSSLFRRAHALSMALDFVARPGPSDEDVSVGHLVRRRLGTAAADRLVGPLLGGISGQDIDDLSAAAAFPQLLAFEREHGSLIRGARATAARRSGEPPFLSLRDGMGGLVDALVERLGSAELATGEAVVAIERTASGWRVVTAKRSIDADLVVLAVPPTLAGDLVRDVSPDGAAALAGIPMRPAALVHLASIEAGAKHDVGHGFVVAASERRSITAVTVASAKWPDRAPGGTLLLRATVTGKLARSGAVTDDQLTRLVTQDVRSILGLGAEPTFTDVHRIADAQAIRQVGHLERVAAARSELARAGSIALVGGAYDGPGIPSIFEGVEREVERLATPR
ncbi:MAG: protoporphyrinogen oxidase [Chloroflexi bacterium]|nr:protoporphyrinogen oxidase [Chloroflexota bacterium]